MKLGKEIKISPKSVGIITPPQHQVTFDTQMVEIPFTVGPNQSGVVYIELEAVLALNKGAKLETTSNVELRKTV